MVYDYTDGKVHGMAIFAICQPFVIPELSTVAMLAIGALTMLHHRRRRQEAPRVTNNAWLEIIIQEVTFRMTDNITC